MATSGNLAAVVYFAGDVSSDIKLNIVNSAGKGVDFETVADIAGSAVLPDVAALVDGRFVIVWNEVGATVDAWGRIYDPKTGNFSGPAFAVATGPGDQFLPTVAGLPDGGFVVTWSDDPAVGNATVQARRFDSSGAPAGDTFVVTETPGSFTAVAASSTGRVFTAWMTEKNAHTTDPDIGINGHIFQAATETVNGTAGKDIITTYNLSEPINGLGGKDRIDARGGDDVISGGAGKDKLTGGPGFDAFVFDVKPKKANVDHITDFAVGVDEIRLDHGIYKKLPIGELAKRTFFSGKNIDEGKNKKDLIAYDKKSGDVWYDPDGAGGHHAKLVAVINHSPNNLSHTDFVIVA